MCNDSLLEEAVAQKEEDDNVTRYTDLSESKREKIQDVWSQLAHTV